MRRWTLITINAGKVWIPSLRNSLKPASAWTGSTISWNEALREYDLTPEEMAAVTRGNVHKIESLAGKLDDRLRKCLIAKLQQ